MESIGIDLGTTYCAASRLDRWGTPCLIPDHRMPTQFQMPSVLLHQTLGTQVGESVIQLLEDTPNLPVVRFAKLRMGTSDSLTKDTNGRDWSPQAVSSKFISKLMRDAFIQNGNAIDAAVITVPANFNDAQRRATRVAGLLAGLKEVHIVEEPVAAAVYFGLQHKANDKTLLVYDLGGGTFDATILQHSNEGLFVLATKGANLIGGKVFDERIMEFLADEYRKLYSVNLIGDPLGRLELYRLAEQVKLALSKEVRVRRAVVLCGRPFEFTISRAHFEQRISSLVEQTLRVCQACLDSCYLTWNDIGDLILTGGSTLVPLVNRMVRESSGLAPSHIHDSEPHYAVAYGAGIIAAKQFSDRVIESMPTLVCQASTFGLGLWGWNDDGTKMRYEELIPRNHPLPCEVSRVLRTNRTGQEKIALEVFTRQDDESAAERLGGFLFGPLPAGAPAGYGVDVRIGINAEGMVEVRALDPNTGEHVHRVLAEGDSDEITMVLREKALLESCPLL